MSNILLTCPTCMMIFRSTRQWYWLNKILKIIYQLHIRKIVKAHKVPETEWVPNFFKESKISWSGNKKHTMLIYLDWFNFYNKVVKKVTGWTLEWGGGNGNFRWIKKVW